MKIRLSSRDHCSASRFVSWPARCPCPRQRRRPHAAHGLEQLEQIRLQGPQRTGRARHRRCHRHQRHEGRRLSICEHRRLLADRPRRRRQHRRRRGEISLRPQSPRRLHPRQGAEVRRLHRRRNQNLRRSARQHRPRISGRPAICRWGVDYVKEDWCNTLPGQNAESSYTLMRDALAATGRPIVFSLCEWGSNKPWLWAGPIGNLWRATGDIQDCWDCKRASGAATASCRSST